ncbi:MAG TPA: ATP-binding cassette domain-containing protein, partial [Clostridia bacterium]|nr:ATP-binding cassette domain-containing protein [Clostridia bacterium]
MGESGSGKTTVGKAIMKICRTNAGEIWFQGKQVNKKLARNELAAYRQAVQMIFQDPMASLNDRA